MKQIRVLSVCTGILGFERAGQLVNDALGFDYYVPVAFSEIDPYCVSVEKHYYPDVPQLGSIKHVSDELIRRGIAFDALFGGIPCQPYAAPGKQMGASDERDLWPDTLPIIQKHRPCFVCIENVGQFAELTDGLSRVQHDLEGEGYTVGSVEIPASSVGASHQRLRTFILAHTNNTGQKRLKCEQSRSVGSGTRNQFDGRCHAEKLRRFNSDMRNIEFTTENERYANRHGGRSDESFLAYKLHLDSLLMADSQSSRDGWRGASIGKHRARRNDNEREETTSPFTICGADGRSSFVADTKTQGRRDGTGLCESESRGGGGRRPDYSNSENETLAYDTSERGRESGQLPVFKGQQRQARSNSHGVSQGVSQVGQDIPGNCGEEQSPTQRSSSVFPAGETDGASQPGMGVGSDESPAPSRRLYDFDTYARLIIESQRQPALMGEDQYDWEPPRLAHKGNPKLWKAQLSALGNAIFPAQAAMPLLALALADLQSDTNS